MRRRIFQHLLFWLAFITLYATVQTFFAGPSDLKYPLWQRFLRFLFGELLVLPWKALPFYVLFYYLIPRYLHKKAYGYLLGAFGLVLIVCILGYRSMVAPTSQFLYGESPNFEVYSLRRLMYTLTDLLPALGLASSVKLLRGRLQSQQRLDALEREKSVAELRFLKAQTNPHFLFNTLNNLYGLARRKDEQTAPAILQLSGIMRYILYECSVPTIPIEKEIQLLLDYIELEKLRYDDRLQLQWEQSVDDPQQPIAPLILLPFVENAFKHGASESRFTIQIQIQIRLEQGQLQMQVENSTESPMEAVEDGIGLQNVKRQLDLLYGSAHNLQITTTDRTFKVNLNIDLNKSENGT